MSTSQMDGLEMVRLVLLGKKERRGKGGKSEGEKSLEVCRNNELL